MRLAGDIPALLIHPDWTLPAPACIWLHGRTAYKELDPGRFARWIKAGIAAVSIDLPGHGERSPARPGELTGGSDAAATLDVLAKTIAEIDRVVEALADPIYHNLFDLDRLALGGMSLGGMATLRRLCDPHPFVCGAVECASGDLGSLYDAARGSRPWGVAYPDSEVAPLDPARHLDGPVGGFRSIPLLALHSESDRIVPWASQRGFLERLRERYVAHAADPALIEVRTWPSTGAPEEHIGFGRVSNEAKNTQAEFLGRWLNGAGSSAGPQHPAK